MLNVEIDLDGFDEFTNKLSRLSQSNQLIKSGFASAVDRIRDVVIEGTPVGHPPEDEHPGLMKKSWKKPTYSYSPSGITATVTNSVDYGVASNYGHYQTPGEYVPAINARLVHYWVPGTYALERSLDEAEYQISPIIQEGIMRKWYSNGIRETFYDTPGGELIDGMDYYDD